MFIDEDMFFRILFPHLQTLVGNKDVNHKLSQVLPQTCLCLQLDENRVKVLDVISQLFNIAIKDKDCDLIKMLMHDMLLLYKQYCNIGDYSG